jgi:Rad3-related DNA helicase
MKIDPDPRSYNLSYDSWWPSQLIALDRIDQAMRENTKVLIIEGPTGTGKSVFPAFFSKDSNTTVLVSSRDLQSQYANLFDWFKIVWGRDHYSCILPSRIALFQHDYGCDPTYADCNDRSSTCAARGDCPYLQAKFEASLARAKVLNYAYAFYAKWWTTNPGLMFLDEAHRIPELLSDLVSIDVTESVKRKFDLPTFPALAGSSRTAINGAVTWANRALEALKDWIALAKELGGDEKQMARAENLQSRLLAISEINPGEDDWYIASGQSLGKFTAKPVFPGLYAQKFIPKEASVTVMMSATIGDPSVLAGELNIHESDFASISLPHILPREQRPILFLGNAPAISRKTTPAEYDYQASLIEAILAQHPDHKGLIHTASWTHARALATKLAKTGRVFLAEGERTETVQRFKKAPNGTVAISPSWGHGLDFPGDEARFGIIAKIPFLSLADPVVSLRLKSSGGRKWYDWNACLSVVQAAGRTVRGIDDWGITYIVDAHWQRVARFAPKWFEVTEI